MRQDQVPNTNFLDCLAGVNRAKIKLPVIHSYILSFTPSFRLVIFVLLEFAVLNFKLKK